MDDIFLNSNERIDDLNLDNLKIIQKVGGYGFTSDSVLLANFVKTKHKDFCVEIGTGCGIISILVNYKEKPNKIMAFEIQCDQSELAKRNVKLCKMEEKIEIINDKIQNWNKYLKNGEVDVVFVNPPYFKYDEKVCGATEEKIISRFDKELPLNDMFFAISKMLKFGGKLYFVNASSRLFDCFCTMKTYGITPKRIYFVHPNKSKNSSVFLCEATLGGKDSLQILTPLFTNDLDGDYIETIQKLYKKRR